MAETDRQPEMAKAYDPSQVEQRIYALWEEGGYFKPTSPAGPLPASREGEEANQPFTIIMPPPNVTGELHLGHALTTAIEDIMVRWQRMKGRPTLFQPGLDHAGISTQNVVEKEIAKEGVTRHDLGREKFLEVVWEWVNKYRHIISNQNRRLGASADWSRETFTLDERVKHAVRVTFHNLYKDGLIYRGERLINWCPRCQTALSDLEVNHEEVQGHLWYLRYPLEAGEETTTTDSARTGGPLPLAPSPRAERGDEDSKPASPSMASLRPLAGRGDEDSKPTSPSMASLRPRAERGDEDTLAASLVETGKAEFIVVATTRPETMVADTAVAISPGSERWGQYLGSSVRLPIVERTIPIIEDDALEAGFGTGALKVTPGHDPTDFEIAERHDLPILNGMELDGRMSEVAGPYAGMDRFAAREAIVKQLDEEGLLEKVEDYTTSIGHCDRCGTIVEPIVSTQWFVKMAPLAKEAIRVVRRNQIRIYPDRFYSTYFQWMENIRDWCISRQLWWGHRIPVWYCANGHQFAAIEDPSTCAECQSPEIEQDEDVLDTWFSSQLWPHVTLGWPEQTEELKRFYPTTVMETGYDIIFFWVARMIMIGLYNTGEIPFQAVYLHGMVRDAEGRKMSKSKGNGIDPLEAADRYGSDALRFTLAVGGAAGSDMRLSDQKLEEGRNFANKVWNIARYVYATSPPSPLPASREGGEANGDREANSPAGLALEDRWILSRVTRLAGEVEHLLETFQFNEAGLKIRDFAWNELADWYVEMSKVRLREGDQDAAAVLRRVLDICLRLLHPFMPFVSEEIWQSDPCARGAESANGFAREPLIVAEWPELEAGLIDEEAEALVEIALEVIRDIRYTRADKGVEAAKWVEAYVIPRPAEEWIALRSGLVGRDIDVGAALEKLSAIISQLARVRPLHLVAEDGEYPREGVATSVLSGARVVLPMGGLFDFAAEKGRIGKQVGEAEAELARLKSKLGDANFRVKAPKEIVAREEARLASVQSRLEGLRQQASQLET